MENLKNKNLAELFDLAVDLNATDKHEFLNIIKQINTIIALELMQLLAIDPTKFGLNIDTHDLIDINN